MIKHVIFDFDGTIVDSRYLAVNLLNQLADIYRFRKIKEEEFENFRSLSIIERCKAVHVPVCMIPRIYVELKNKYQQTFEQLNLYNGIKKVIWALKEKGLELSIISSNSIDIIGKLCKKNNIDIFDIYTSRYYMGKEWAIQAFLRKHKLMAKEIVYIGDEYRDIVACKKNNVKIIAVTWGYDSLEMLTAGKPNFIAKTPDELLNIITNKI